LKNAKASYDAGAVVVKSEVTGLAPGLNFHHLNSLRNIKIKIKIKIKLKIKIKNKNKNKNDSKTEGNRDQLLLFTFVQVIKFVVQQSCTQVVPVFFKSLKIDNPCFQGF
jgi:hypothetical protein